MPLNHKGKDEPGVNRKHLQEHLGAHLEDLVCVHLGEIFATGVTGWAVHGWIFLLLAE